jgi:ketosteroid isomerase-like protein
MPGPPGANDPAVEALIQRCFAAINGDDLDAFASVFAEDCVDHNPLPGQPPGLPGIQLKHAFFRAAAPDARTMVEAISREEDGYRVRWTTSATGLGTYRYTGLCRVEGGRIRELRVLSSLPLV